MGILDGLMGNNQPKYKSIYKKTLTNTEFALTADVALAAAKWTLVAEYTVPAQQIVAVGATETINGGATGRPAYIRLDSTGGQITGQIRISVVDANDQGQVIADHNQAEWSASKTSRTDALLMPETRPAAKEDSKIQIWMKAGSASTVDYDDADTIIQLPVTVYTL